MEERTVKKLYVLFAIGNFILSLGTFLRSDDVDFYNRFQDFIMINISYHVLFLFLGWFILSGDQPKKSFNRYAIKIIVWVFQIIGALAAIYLMFTIINTTYNTQNYLLLLNSCIPIGLFLGPYWVIHILNRTNKV